MIISDFCLVIIHIYKCKSQFSIFNPIVKHLSKRWCLQQKSGYISHLFNESAVASAADNDDNNTPITTANNFIPIWLTLNKEKVLTLWTDSKISFLKLNGIINKVIWMENGNQWSST